MPPASGANRAPGTFTAKQFSLASFSFPAHLNLLPRKAHHQSNVSDGWSPDWVFISHTSEVWRNNFNSRKYSPQLVHSEGALELKQGRHWNLVTVFSVSGEREITLLKSSSFYLRGIFEDQLSCHALHYVFGGEQETRYLPLAGNLLSSQGADIQQHVS